MSHKHRNKKNKIINIGAINISTNKNELSLRMPSKIREDILNIIEKTIITLERKFIDTPVLESLSKNTIHNTSIYQDKDSMNISIILYSLYKLFSFKIISSKQKSNLIFQFKKIKQSLLNNNLKEYRMGVEDVIKLIYKINKRFTKYVQDVMDKARIKKGSDLYRHGISIGMIAELFGTSEWEIMSYIGKTNMNDEEPITDALSRWRYAENFFRIV